ncbi:SusD/RagB family nutrient-binding outer membrane lipoprotein [Reichenbachiella agariperforans]|uniref:SusD/RagB family nutrient-binding outer membrane lipoprotein n=1 Tax=Reichenbachiella agariperforans TaxID=156994 RepID=UPI001C0A4634|nr:SusD/RagB family nutrient-binding outer membrane lipoprotein [Reichenbachiella agariperforans]MBU2912921.1 SusD/RagB family nutrient-binding outer membrane lipoprotein [Reichenbachiella agariperforans]
MKKINIKAIPVALALAFAVSACDQGFEETNVNPNSPEAVPASLLLPTVIRKGVSETAGLAWGYGNVVMQYSAKIQFTNEDRYNWGPASDPYDPFFNSMRDVQNIINISEESGEDNYKGVALVMKSWMYSVMTDTYGDLPYTQAVAAKSGVNSPVFDTQSDIYAGIIADLESANTLLDPLGASIEGDILFAGDIMLWKKFANSLLLRIHMRLSDRIDPSAAMQAIMSDASTYPIMTGNEDNAALQYLQDNPNQQPLYTTRSGSFDEYRLSENMEDILKSLNDNRIYAYAQPTTNSGAGLVGALDDYQGVPNGLADEEALAYSPSGEADKGGSNYISRVGLMFSCSACDDLASPIARQSILMSYSELQFVLAEARERGFISTGDAETYYTNGIQSSFDYYISRLDVGGYTDISAAVVPDATYFTQADVAYTGTQAELLEKIGTQKWIALFFSGMEAWFDWRRTGYPTITPGAGAVQSTVPVRFIYPTDVQALNKDNYDAVIARQGPDNLNTKVWWDIN